MFEPKEFPDRNIEKASETMENKRKMPPMEVLGAQEEVEIFNKFMFYEEIDDPSDPINIMAEAHNRTLAEMKEQLLHSLNKRKGKSLSITLKIFNKLQD